MPSHKSGKAVAYNSASVAHHSWMHKTVPGWERVACSANVGQKTGRILAISW